MLERIMKDFLFTLLAWLLTLPLIIGGIMFALYNGHDVEVTYTPFGNPVIMPVYIPVLGAIALGFILGSLMTWAGMSTLRKASRDQRKKIRQLEKQLDEANTNAAPALKTHNYSLIPTNFKETK
jgi:uncharacterized integral membrane protein